MLTQIELINTLSRYSTGKNIIGATGDLYAQKVSKHRLVLRAGKTLFKKKKKERKEKGKKTLHSLFSLLLFSIVSKLKSHREHAPETATPTESRSTTGSRRGKRLQAEAIEISREQ